MGELGSLPCLALFGLPSVCLQTEDTGPLPTLKPLCEYNGESQAFPFLVNGEPESLSCEGTGLLSCMLCHANEVTEVRVTG